MKTFFITSSGTEIGKTFVTTLLATQLTHSGYRVRALKPLATGFDLARPENSDSDLLLRAVDLRLDEKNLARVSPWRFSAALSPDVAAELEGRNIDLHELTDFCLKQEDADVTLIEGIGGVMVPLNQEHTVLDWIQALGAPVVLVVGSYLGTLSHALSAAGMLQARGQTIAGVIISESTNQPMKVEKTAWTLERFLHPIPIQILPRLESQEAAPNLLTLLDLHL